MATIIDESNVYRKLRDKAETQLQTGTTPKAGHWSMGLDALRMLHQLSSDPGKAEDALKLLHELQVHQVELDLQNEEIADNELALVEELSLYRTLYDHAPIAYYVVDQEGEVIQGNLAAAVLLGVTQDNLEGRRIDTFLTSQSRPRLLDLLQGVAQSGTKASCVVEISKGATSSRQAHLVASRSPESTQLLLACCECDRAN